MAEYLGNGNKFTSMADSLAWWLPIHFYGETCPETTQFYSDTGKAEGTIIK